MNKQDGQKQIERLVKKYENLSPAERRKYNESMTCKDFILPLFQALGWDVYNKFTDYEVTSEAQVSGKRVDYAFHSNNTTKFFLEAKKIEVDLREERWAEQAVMYAWHKSVPWAILTDFESLKVFNAEWDEPDIEKSIIFEIPYQNYLTDERLWLLSKQAMESGELDKYATENFKKPKREPVDKQLAADLVRWRKILFDNIKAWNSDKSLNDKQIGEAVQRMLDRLIFIRTTEDKGIENKHLQELERSYRENKKDFSLEKELIKLFKNYDEWYNSKLFQFPHICDNLEYEGSFLADIIKELYKNRKGIRYDFASINADVLGGIYEQYLGQIQREDGKEKKSSKRKSQGIYYTPRYIVDYIVQNTLGEVLKGKPAHEAQKIKVLDPACGSGSFLIKAFEVLDEHIKREKNQKGADPIINYARKLPILISNIYGVDLDPEAIEIAQLNLLLKTLEDRERLPNLSHNIECGNSLISGNEEELKKYFGKDWKAKKPFNWEEKFKDVFKQGGFDVIIGNPPYIDSEEMVKKDKDFRLYCSDIYESAKGNWDIFCVFIQRGLDLIKDGGYLGIIVPNKLLSADYAFKIREIIKRYSIISINDYSDIHVFGANVYPIVILIKKQKPNSSHQILINSFKEKDGLIELNKQNKINQSILDLYKNSWSPIFNYSEETNFVDEIIRKSKPLKEFCNVYGAATVAEAYKLKEILKNLDKEKDYFKFINTGTIDRYIQLWDKGKTQYIKQSYLKPIVMKNGLKEFLPNRYNNSVKEKIIIAGMTKKIESVLDSDGEFLAGKSTTIIETQKVNLKFIIGILNSKLLTFIYKNIFKSLSLAGGFLRIGTPQIKELPIIIPDETFIKNFVIKVDKIINLNQNLQKLDPILDEEEYKELKSEIDKTDKEIDKKVYKLYGLTEEKIKVVENS